MTTSTENRIDEMIGRLKSRAAMRQFGFIPGFPPHKTPNPVTKYTVAVTQTEQFVKRYFIGGLAGKNSCGRLCEVKLCLRVYAPQRTSGSALLRASAMVADALEASDSERLIVGTSFSGIGFDTASRTEYRDIVALLRILTEEEAST